LERYPVQLETMALRPVLPQAALDRGALLRYSFRSAANRSARRGGGFEFRRERVRVG
jgi:hypothetical protein